MATNGNLSSHEQYAAPTSTAEGASATSSNNNLPKDEVGWYFVEQYYTTLSKNPEKLHLFYGKRSQFVYGPETEVTPVAVGRASIQDRIKALDFQDCKVRISNVDSQGSGECIVIQVIGEISNKGGEPKKFVQTFILAQQPSGYFVLNDILRYINDEAEDEPEQAVEEAAPAELTAPEAEAAPEPEEPEMVETEEAVEEEQESVAIDTSAVDKKLEEHVAEVPPESAVETPAEPATEIQEASTKTETTPETLPDPDKVVQEIAEEETKKAEIPKDPTPTPATAARAPPQAAAPAEPERPKEPPKPMTWASRAAAAAGAPRPVVPVIPKAATPAVAVPRPQAPAAAQAPAPVAKAQETAAAPAPAKEQGSEWETAQTKRQNRPQSISSAPADKESPMAYIKYVTEKVQTDDLKAALAKYGELAYFDINRQKNCAFVEFATQAGYNAAVAANPHVVNGESIVVEQRRPKANAYGGSNYNTVRPGGAPNRGRGGFEGSRGTSQGNMRGSFSGQTRGGRGGAGTARGGRGTAQAGNA